VTAPATAATTRTLRTARVGAEIAEFTSEFGIELVVEAHRLNLV